MEKKERKTDWVLYTNGRGKYPYTFKNSDGEILGAFLYAEPFREGFALVRSKAQGETYSSFIDEQGYYSEPFMDARSYKNGFAWVKIDRGQYAYRDKNRIISDFFYYAGDYSADGFAIVQYEKHGAYQIRNAQGKVSKEYFSSKSFARDCIENDLAKRLTFDTIESEKTIKETKPESPKTGDEQKSNLDKYFGYEATIYDLTPEEILANLERIQAFEEYNYYMALEHCDSSWNMMELFLNYQTIAQYIKQTAYEAEMKTKKNPTLDEWREELKGKPLF